MFEELQIHVQYSMLFTWLLTKAFLLVYLIKSWLQNSLIIHEGKDKENHYRVGGFICDKKSCSFT
jgi:hypothetical protein